ncbi:PQQ-binding-like beta-propeller repeat protein [Streptomyces sp. NPDC047315]|uniref:outer membrane protein assembly factor BamB family protein n=1 Tax=Streptomyces sp. NPDC047315 TaxID=3155142 RepID=UPI0033E46608
MPPPPPPPQAHPPMPPAPPPVQPAGPYGQQPGPYQPAPGPYGQPGADAQHHQGAYRGGYQDGYQGPYQGGYQGPYQGASPGPYQYAHSGPPTPPGPVPPPGGGRFKGRTAVVVAASVAALLVIGGGSYVALSGDDGKDTKSGGQGKASQGTDPAPSGSASEGGSSTGGGSGSGAGLGEGAEDLNAGRQPGDAKALFRIKNDVDLPRNGAEVFGPWVVGDTVVKAMYKQVVGYSVTDGATKWTVPLEQEACSATPRPSADGKIVVGYKNGPTDKAKCRNLRMIDVPAGKAGWQKEIPEADGFLGLSDHTLTIAGNTLAAGGTGVSYGFSLADGRELFKSPASGCKPFSYAGGPKLLAAVSCPTKDYSKPRHQLQEVDPTTGRAKWTYSTPIGWEIDKVYSADPIVISLTRREPKGWTVLALRSDGKLRSQIAGGKDKFQVRCSGSLVVFGQNLEGCTGVVADARKLYLGTSPVRAGGPNEVVAFDLDSGKPAWRAPAGGDTSVVPLRMDGDRLAVYREPSYDKGGAVATIAPSGGAPQVVLQHPDGAADVENSLYSPRPVYADGRFFIASGRVSARDDKAETETATMLAFGK